MKFELHYENGVWRDLRVLNIARRKGRDELGWQRIMPRRDPAIGIDDQCSEI